MLRTQNMTFILCIKKTDTNRTNKEIFTQVRIGSSKSIHIGAQDSAVWLHEHEYLSVVMINCMCVHVLQCAFLRVCRGSSACAQ